MASISPSGKVRLIKNVPFSANYKDVITFNSATEREAYFKSLSYIEIDNCTYVRNTGELKVPYQKDAILEYNYMMYQNENYSDKWFYAFILNMAYVSSNVTALKFEIDVWQTYQFDYTFRDSYIEREHQNRWNSLGFPIWNYIDENLEIGSEYVTKKIETIDFNKVYWIVFVTSADIYGDNTGSYIVQNSRVQYGIPCNLNYIYYPLTGGISPFSVVNNNTLTGLTNIIEQFKNSELLVNTLKACYLTTVPPFDYSLTDGGSGGGVSVNASNLSIGYLQVSDELFIEIAYASLSTASVNTYTTSLFDNFTKFEESKLMGYPYSFVELTDNQGDSFIIKPQYVGYGSSGNLVINLIGALDSSHKEGAYCHLYCGESDYIGNGIINANQTNVPIIDDYTAAYLQGNSNTIQASLTNVLNSNSANEVIANNNANLNSQLNQVNTVASFGKAGVGIGNTGIMSAMQTGSEQTATKGGMLSSIGSNAISAAQNYANTYYTNKNNLNNTIISGEAVYENAQRSAIAKIQDARKTADNVALQGGNVGFTYVNDLNFYKLKWKQLNEKNANILTDYFKKYGYACHRLKTPDLFSRKYYNYIQTIDANITGNIPQEYIIGLRTIFDSGVTLWHTTDVGNYSLDNSEV